jgi:hypothetical protein
MGKTHWYEVLYIIEDGTIRVTEIFEKPKTVGDYRVHKKEGLIDVYLQAEDQIEASVTARDRFQQIAKEVKSGGKSGKKNNQRTKKELA